MTKRLMNRRKRWQGLALILTLATTFILPGTPGVRAADGDLDTTFGAPNGFVTAPADTHFNDVAIQPDGKIVAAGAKMNFTDFLEIPIVARFNTDGTPDLTFGTGGIAEPQGDIGSSTNLSDIALQLDGMIVVGGTTDLDLYVARLEATGAVDTAFGDGGFQEIDFSSNDILRGGVAIDPSGNIVVAGSSSFTYTLARLTSSGILDSTFGTGGKVTTPNGASAGVAVLSDGRILIAGESFEVLRFTTSGVLDTTFGGGDGRAGAGAPLLSQCHGMAVQPDGRIVLVGAIFDPGMALVEALVRFDFNGTLDPGFGTGGRVAATPIPPGHRALDVTFRSDGRVVTCGVIGEGPTTGLLSRYQSDGTPDSSFGTAGRVVTDLPGNTLSFAGLAIQSDGKIVVAGAIDSASSSTVMGVVLRFGGSAGPPSPPPPSFNICVEKNSRILSFNSTTGTYEFRDCSKGFVLTGTGEITVNSCKLELRDSGPNSNHPDRNVLVKVNTCTKVGQVSIVTTSPAKTYSYTDSDISVGNCTCP
jgi:uncharacterized delta-60 repeat protein